MIRTHCRIDVSFRLSCLSVFAVLFCTLCKAETHEITLQWDASTSEDVAGYYIYYGTDGESYTEKLDAGMQLTMDIPGLQEGFTYYFAATTYDSLGMESNYSNEVGYYVAVPGEPSPTVTPTRTPTLTFTPTFTPTPTDTPGTVDLISGLNGHWTLDEGSGLTANDSSPWGNAGTLVNGPQWTEGTLGGGLQFDGLDDYVDLGTSTFNLTNQLGISFWIDNVQTTGSYAQIIFARGQYLYPFRVKFLNSSQKIEVRFRTDDTTSMVSNSSFSLDSPNHVAVTYNGVSLRIYLNGYLDAAKPWTGPLGLGSGSTMTTLGGYFTDEPFKGTVDDLRIYNRTLTNEEIQTLAEMVYPSATPTRTATSTPSSSVTGTPTPTVTETIVPTPSWTPTATSSSTPTWTQEPTATFTWIPTRTSTATATSTSSPTRTSEPTSTATASPTHTVEPTATATSTPTRTVAPSATPTSSPTQTVAPSATATSSPTVTTESTATSTSSPTWTEEPTATSTSTPTWTSEPTGTATLSSTSTVTATETSEPSATSTPTQTQTVVWTLTPTPTQVFIQAEESGPDDFLDRSVASDSLGQTETSTSLVLRSGSQQEFILMRWTLNGLPADSSLVTAADLVLTVSEFNTSNTFNLQLKALTQARPYFPDVSWTTYDGILPWPEGNLGAQAAVEPIIDAVPVESGVSEVRLDVTQLLKDLIEGTRLNHGVVLVPLSGGLPVDVRFHSSESGQTPLRPRLEVTYLEGGTQPLDSSPPTGSVKFLGDKKFTNRVAEDLELSATDDGEAMTPSGKYRISLDNTNWSEASAFETQTKINLGAEDGTKRVYVEYLDEVGNAMLRPATASIVLDREPPNARVNIR